MTTLEVALRGGSIAILLLFSVLCFRFPGEFFPLRYAARIAVLLLAPIHGFALIAAELLSPGASLAETGRTVNSWVIAIGTWLTVIFFLRPYPVMMVPKPDIAIVVTARDKVLLDKLDRLMREECLYRDDQLSIARLATRMDMGENRLRKLINASLGPRNFSAFVNGYRLAEATAALADPAQADVPILTIALDSGFGSVGPFNRAFKANTGVTPREFDTVIHRLIEDRRGNPALEGRRDLLARLVAARDNESGRKGAYVAINPWIVHRHRRLWDNPLRFDPERFSPERAAGRPRFAYLPFGGGPRICIGASFAMMEAILVLATLAQKYRSPGSRPPRRAARAHHASAEIRHGDDPRASGSPQLEVKWQQAAPPYRGSARQA